MKKKIKLKAKWIWLALGISFAAGGFYYYKQQAKNRDDLPMVTTTEVTAERGDLIISLESDGSATIDYQNIDAEVTGKLTKVYVKSGDRIKKGQILAEIDATEYQKMYETAQIAYEKAKLTYQSKVQTSTLENTALKQALAEEKIKYEELLGEYNTMVTLKASYAQAEIDGVKAQMEGAKRTYENDQNKTRVTTASNYGLNIEKMNVEMAKVQLEEAQEALDQCTIKSHTEGYVLKVTYGPGDMIEPNTNTGSLTSGTDHFMVVTPSSNYQILTSVSEQDLSLASVGQEVEVVFDALGGETYSGKVIEIEQLPNTATNGVISYNVTAQLDSGFEEIRIGMTAQIKMILKKEENVIMIPNKAVTLEKGQQQVLLKKENNTTEVKNITAGLTDGRNVAVRQGLEVGDVVVYETTTK